MLLKAQDLFELATAHYEDRVRLRSKQDALDRIRYRRYVPGLPRAVAGRSRAIHADIMGEKLEKAKVLLENPHGPKVSVAAYATDKTADTRREQLQNWLYSALMMVEQRSIRPFFQLLIEDLLVRSYAAVLILPNPGAWRAMPSVDLSALTDLKAQQEAAREMSRRQEAFARQRFPIRIERAPADGVIPIENGMGDLYEVWDIRAYPVREVLEKWKDKHGKPRATQLAQLVNESRLTLRDEVPVLQRADDEHIQIATLSLPMWRTQDRRRDPSIHPVEQVLDEWEHHMGAVPYAIAGGRETTSDDPVFRYKGFLDPIDELGPAYDDFITQLYTAARAAAWPTLVLEVADNAAAIPGTNDKTPKFRLEEAAINRLPKGYKLQNPQLTNSQDFQVMNSASTEIKRQIEMHTFTAAAYGDASANSGYLQSQLEGATKQVLQPFARGYSRLLTRTSELTFRAGRAMVEATGMDIPVKNVAPQGKQWITLTADHTRYDWLITVETDVQPVGGEAAALEVEKNKVAAGWSTNEQAMERLGDRHPEQTLEAVMAEKLITGPTFQQSLEQAFAARVAPALMEQGPGQVAQPLLGPGAAANVTNPELLARMPAGTPMPQNPPVPGEPNLANTVQQPAPPPPTPRGRDIAPFQNPGQAGPIPGMAQGQPGGVKTERDVRKGYPPA